MDVLPFSPAFGSTLTLTPGAASASAAIDPQMLCTQLRLINAGSNICFIRTYSSKNGSAPTAGTTDYPVPPNMISTITKPQNHDAMVHISAVGTTLYTTIGVGI